MNDKRDEILQKILAERKRQLNLPGSEWDLRREPNDWLSIAGRYLFEGASTKNQKPSKDEFEDVLIKAAAVILAALEHIEVMENDGKLKK